uniref:DNA-directed primase/polymerase protein n=1 Tax=Lygus hesperus TaxID=30085 RepID=A0A0A9XIQ3_LYGHE
MSDLSSQPTRSFYGAGCSLLAKQLQRNAALAKQSVIPFVLKDLLNGPCITWKVFKKQEDALNYAKSAKGSLMTFAFEPQDFSTGRLFLAAHPEVFWHYDSQRSNSERCSYEVITEAAACKLYADLEYDKCSNPHSKGQEMVSIFIDIVCKAIFREWGVRCLREHVLDLDSSTSAKFSRHLIFNLPSACFGNNHHVGIFLKRLCQDVTSSIDMGVVSDSLQGTSLSDLRQLFVLDGKGNQKLFCDLSVYSKNRHFRVYRSTKKGKNAPLLLSADNTFEVSGDLNTFLSSLVTYVSSNCRVLEVKNVEMCSGQKGPRRSIGGAEGAAPSPLPIVDKFINHAVHPGRVQKSYYFASSKVIVYNIVGNRFCGNINREHKSNNVKFVVDLDKYEYYQKCHDFECSGYRSPAKPLPPEVVFQISDSSDLSSPDTLGVFGLTEEEAADVLDVLEAVGSTEFSQFTDEIPKEDVSPKMDVPPEDIFDEDASKTVDSLKPDFQTTETTPLQKFPSFGLSDEAFNSIDY